MDQETQPVNAPSHPIQTLGVFKVSLLYLFISISIYVLSDVLFGIKLTSNPERNPLGSILLSLVDVLLQGLFICYFLKKLKPYGVSWQSLISPFVSFKQSLSYLPIFTAQLVLSIFIITLFESIWPASSSFFEGTSHYLPPAEHLNQSEVLSLFLFNGWSLIYVTLLGPICEELVFRGWLLHRLAYFWRSVPVAICLSSLLFGLLHGAHFFGATCFGLMVSAVYLKTGSLRLSILLHVLNNLIAMSAAIFSDTSSNQTLSQTSDITNLVIQALILVTSLSLFIWLLIRTWPDKNQPLPMLPQGIHLPKHPITFAQPNSVNPSDYGKLRISSALVMLLSSLFLSSLIGFALSSLLNIMPSSLIQHCCHLRQQFSGIINLALGLGIWNSWLFLRYQPLPFKITQLFPFKNLPKGSSRLLAVLSFLALSWHVLSAQAHYSSFNTFSIEIRFLSENVAPSMFILLMGLLLLVAFLQTVFEQHWRSLVKSRCNSFIGMLVIMMPVSFLLHLTNPFTAMLSSLWLMLLSLKGYQSLSLIRAQLLFELILLSLRLGLDKPFVTLYGLPYISSIWTILLILALVEICRSFFQLHRNQPDSASNKPEPEDLQLV